MLIPPDPAHFVDPGCVPAEVGAVLEAGFRLLYRAGERPPAVDLEERLAEAEW